MGAGAGSNVNYERVHLKFYEPRPGPLRARALSGG